MLLGIERIVNTDALETGRFYLGRAHNMEPTVFQCISDVRGGGAPALLALWFAPQTDRPLNVGSVPHGPVVSLPKVHVRIDAPSMYDTKSTSDFRLSMFLVSGDEAFVVAAAGDRAWIVNISTGKLAAPTADWVAFSRWLLVIDDNGEEIPIVSFGEKPPG